MLDQRCRRWANIKTLLVQHLLFIVSPCPGIHSTQIHVIEIHRKCYGSQDLSYANKSSLTSIFIDKYFSSFEAGVALEFQLQGLNHSN